MKTCDVAIVGGGIVGAACARSLANAGLRVLVIEQHFIGSGATAAGMGHLVAMDDSDAQFALTRYSQELWNDLSDRLPDDVEYQQCGTLWIAADDDEWELVRAKHDYYQARGTPCHQLNAAELAACEPNLRSGLAGALLVPDDAVIYPPTAAQWLLKDAEKSRAALLQGSVTEVFKRRLTVNNGESIDCGMWINAAGTAAGKLTPGVPVRPRKGHLIITDRYPGFVHHQLVELGYLKSAHGTDNESVALNVQPRRTGQLLIGSSRQFDITNKDVESAILQRMIVRAASYMPQIGQLSVIRCWTGFRAATPDSLPLIGPWPNMEGCYLATGHEGLGITTSLATAELIKAQILSQAAPIPVRPYLPDRFLSLAANSDSAAFAAGKDRSDE